MPSGCRLGARQLLLYSLLHAASPLDDYSDKHHTTYDDTLLEHISATCQIFYVTNFISIFYHGLSIHWRQKLKHGSFGRLGSTMAESRIKYNRIKGVETLEEYRPGGYHPVIIGDMLHGRYHIADKLGCGGYSTVWLARDTQMQRYVAVKVNIADSFPRETKALKALSAPLPPSLPEHPGRGLIPAILDEFKVRGPNGEHACYTVTPAQCNLREISFSRLFSLEVARALSYGLAQAVAFTHSRGYVHGGLS